jgi:hypothetical protein
VRGDRAQYLATVHFIQSEDIWLLYNKGREFHLEEEATITVSAMSNPNFQN